MQNLTGNGEDHVSNTYQGAHSMRCHFTNSVMAFGL